jgi:hypothetical protein
MNIPNLCIRTEDSFIISALPKVLYSHTILRNMMINGGVWMIECRVAFRGEITRHVSLSITTETNQLLWQAIWVEAPRAHGANTGAAPSPSCTWP